MARNAARGVGGVAEGGHELTGIGSNLGALELPRGIAALVEMKCVYPTCRATAVELEFDFHLGTRHCLATDPAGLFASRSAADAVIISRGQFPSANCCSGLFTQRLIGHCPSPRRGEQYRAKQSNAIRNYRKFRKNVRRSRKQSAATVLGPLRCFGRAVLRDGSANLRHHIGAGPSSTGHRSCPSPWSIRSAIGSPTRPASGRSSLGPRRRPAGRTRVFASSESASPRSPSYERGERTSGLASSGPTRAMRSP